MKCGYRIDRNKEIDVLQIGNSHKEMRARKEEGRKGITNEDTPWKGTNYSQGMKHKHELRLIIKTIV